MKAPKLTIGDQDRIAYRVSEVVALLGIGKTTVYELINSGELPAFKIGGSTLVDKAGLEALIERSRIKPNSD
jgi:excisionase family DNA binding protein